MKQYLQLYIAFLRLGAFTFGGGLAMLPLLKREAVTKTGWLSEEALIDLYAVAQSLPGIIAVNTAVYVGNRVAGVRGGVCAALGQITSPVCVMTLIALLFRQFTEQPMFVHALAGVRAMVCALLCHTVWTLAKKSIVDMPTMCVGGLVLLLAWLTQMPTIVLTLGAGCWGLLWKARRK